MANETTTTRGQSLGWLLGFLGLTFAAAALGGAFTSRSVNTWYRTLRRPRWSPPDWLFGPVWTILYATMALAAWLVRRQMDGQPERRSEARAALAAWIAQLALNVSWSWAFFGRRSVAGGLAAIVALWTWIVATTVLAGRVSRRAGGLLLPYLSWTTFAAAINFRVWQLNRGRSEAGSRGASGPAGG